MFYRFLRYDARLISLFVKPSLRLMASRCLFTVAADILRLLAISLEVQSLFIILQISISRDDNLEYNWTIPPDNVPRSFKPFFMTIRFDLFVFPGSSIIRFKTGRRDRSILSVIRCLIPAFSSSIWLIISFRAMFFSCRAFLSRASLSLSIICLERCITMSHISSRNRAVSISGRLPLKGVSTESQPSIFFLWSKTGTKNSSFL